MTYPVAACFLIAALVAGLANRRRGIRLAFYSLFAGGAAYLIWIPVSIGFLAVLSVGLGTEFALVGGRSDADLANVSQLVTAFLGVIGLAVHARATRHLAIVRRSVMAPPVFTPAPGNVLFRSSMKS